MPVFVEDPLSRIVRVHWKDSPEPPGPGDDDVCGKILLNGASGADFGGQGIIVLKSDGPWSVAAAGNMGIDLPPDQPYGLINALAAYFYEPRDTLVWNTAESFTVSFGASAHPTDQFRLQEYRNVNVQRFAGLYTPEDVPPDQRISLPGSMTILKQQPGEIYPPFYTVEYKFYTFWVRHLYPGGGIQAHCIHETIDGLPPQPPDYVLDLYQPYPGSSSDPVRPPPDARLTPRGRIQRWT